eukprot:scaffold189655_cov31-Tisochrysis_lutea.AAC.1
MASDSARRSPRANVFRSAVDPSEERSSAVSVVLWLASASKMLIAPIGPMVLAPALSQMVESDRHNRRAMAAAPWSPSMFWSSWTSHGRLACG